MEESFELEKSDPLYYKICCYKRDLVWSCVHSVWHSSLSGVRFEHDKEVQVATELLPSLTQNTGVVFIDVPSLTILLHISITIYEVQLTLFSFTTTHLLHLYLYNLHKFI